MKNEWVREDARRTGGQLVNQEVQGIRKEKVRAGVVRKSEKWLV